MTVTEFYEAQSSQIYQIKEWCQEIFGENNVDIQKCSSFCDSFYNVNQSFENFVNSNTICYVVYIHLPERTVTNENGNSHKVYDGYVNFYIFPNLTVCKLCKIGYTRSRMTIREIANGYGFSHTPIIDSSVIQSWREGNTVFQSLCFGSGPILTSNSRLNNEYSEVNWKLFLNDLDDYFNIESLAGIPYRSLECLYSNNQEYIKISSQFKYITPISINRRNLLMDFIDYLQSKNWFSSISYTNYNGVPTIETSYTKLYESICEKFRDFIEEAKNNESYYQVIKEDLNYFTLKYLRIEDPGNVLVLKNSNIDPNFNFQEPFSMGFIFNGERIFFDIIEDTESVNDNSHIGFSICIFNRLLNSIIRCITFHFDNNEHKLFL